MTADDRLSAELAAIGHRSDFARQAMTAPRAAEPARLAAINASGEDVPRLLAAVEAALKLAAESDEPAVDWGGVPLSPAVFVVRCDSLREAITSALLGEDSRERELRAAAGRVAQGDGFLACQVSEDGGQGDA